MVRADVIEARSEVWSWDWGTKSVGAGGGPRYRFQQGREGGRESQGCKGCSQGSCWLAARVVKWNQGRDRSGVRGQSSRLGDR